jgi:hypothetical protein
LLTPDDDGVVIEVSHANTTTDENPNASAPFFANPTSNTTTALPENIDETQEQGIADRGWGVSVTRRDVFRYGTVLAGAVWVTGVTFTQTDPSTKYTRESMTPPLSKVTSPKLEPVNLTKVASETNVNVTINCEKMCVSIDSSNFTFNKVEKAKTPGWLPSWLAPKSQVVKKIPNSELLVAATAAGAVTEMVRTSLLYPLQTVKVRLQTDRDGNLFKDREPQQIPSLSEQLKTLGSNIKQKIDDGDLYAGLSPTLLVSVPATGIYYGVRDVAKRLLFMTPLDATTIAVAGALVGDVVSLCFRVPSDALAIRLQTQNDDDDAALGDWLGDAFQRLPMVILTDLPYLASKIILNKSLIQGSMSVSEYALFAAIASIVAGALTTPFDVARTRILLDKWSVDDSDDETEVEGIAREPDGALNGSDIENSERLGQESKTIGNPGDSVLRTMIQITKEGDGGIGNLFSGWLERVVYLGIGRAWLEPIQLIGYIGIRDAVLLEWF